ncbi:peptide ABC transporter permease [Pandoraea terrae]|uniref:Peptide ABC transporter permease n=1 Tax=Pandoraea terrae TaxID=1537710 RepID=A0A5E4VX05_9BURK|nr:ABC transporter permease [Pandoraea terrae]VVE16982.1 peptide ABC transporter permease [Pandoraea terrae]
MRNLGYITQRLGYGLVMVLAVVVLNFLLLRLAPGDIADMLAAQAGGATQEQVQQIRQQLGLDRGVGTQLATYLKEVAQGHLGQSLYYNASVSQLILDRAPATLALVVLALLLAIVIGTLLGIVSARKPRGWLSHVVTVVSLVGFSAPVFWSGIMLLIVFAYWIPLFPASGMLDVGVPPTGFTKYVQIAHHLVLPVTTLALVYLAQYSRQARASMLDVLGADYIRTARAKGLTERRVVYVHALKNALIPIVTLAGLQFSQVLAGAVLVETVFNWPGLGRLAFDAVLNRDYALLLGILLASAILVVIMNMLTDFSYRLLDPRMRSTR